MTEPDDILIERVRRGDDDAFEHLFVRHYAQVYRVLYSLVGTREASEDLAQETFLQLYRHAPAVQAGGTVAAWLCKVAINRGYNYLRDERRAQQRLEHLATGLRADPYAELARSEERALVREVLARLPERQVKLLLLRNAGLSLAEIAAALDLAPGSVGTLLARAERAFAGAYELMNRGEPPRDRATGRSIPYPEEKKL